MKRLFTILLQTGLILASVNAQAPIAPERENSLERIDSLTRLFYEFIPSHTSVTDTAGYWSGNGEDFTKTMSYLGSEIAFSYHEMVGGQIRYFLSLGDNYYNMIHSRMQVYFPIYEQILDKHKLPQELKYVSIIESNLNPNAVSWCGATGLWQFMPYTGRDMAMRIDYSIDERKSIITSTEKACEYLKAAYNQFGDWLLAIASYNCGRGNVQNAINRAGSKDFWKVKYFLPKETQYYVPKFIAMTYVMNYTKFANNTFNCSRKLLVSTPVDSSISIAYLAKVLNVTSEEIEGYNRELLKKTTPQNRAYQLLLPYELSMKFVSMQDSLFADIRRIAAEEAARQPTYVQKLVPYYHTVRRGESLSLIARKYGTTVQQIKNWNHLKSNTIHPGNNLLLYKWSWVIAKIDE